MIPNSKDCSAQADMERKLLSADKNSVSFVLQSLYHRRLESRHEPGSLYLSYNGSNRSARFRLLILFGSPLLKKRGASSVSHLGSIAMHSRMYSLVVRISSW